MAKRRGGTSGRRRGARAVLRGVAACGATLTALAALADLTGAAAVGAVPTAPLGVAAAQYASPAAIAAAAGDLTSPWDPRQITAPGGAALIDSSGRTVSLHGVNAVYKLAPYELTVAPGAPSSFTAADATRLAQLGFDVVRLGILWQGIEPGSGGPNSPAVCQPGTPHDPGMFSAPVADASLDRVAQVVDRLGREHIHTIIDMHQDVYSQAFSGEGAPAWAVCTNGVPPTVLPGRWSRNYTNPGFKVSIDHFFANDVAGDLQGEFDRTWGVVAATFAANPWVIGYDPFNEPYARAVSDAASPLGGADQSAALECLYTGRTDPGLSVTGRRLSCPATVPAEGVIPTIEAADPTHLVFVEPDILSTNSDPDLLGPMPFGRLVYNFHAYCGSRSPVTGDPTDPARCTARIVGLMRTAQAARTLLGSPQQPGGPAWFMSEFGAMTSTATLDPVVAEAQRLGVGWAYWSWKYYGDPTGSSHEALVGPDGSLGPQAESLVRPYAEAVAGRAPIETFDPASNVYTLTYRSDPTVADPTVVMTVPSYRYAAGYCADITGGRIASVAGSPKLVVFNAVGATQVTVELEPGPCDGRG